MLVNVFFKGNGVIASARKVSTLSTQGPENKLPLEMTVQLIKTAKPFFLPNHVKPDQSNWVCRPMEIRDYDQNSISVGWQSPSIAVASWRKSAQLHTVRCRNFIGLVLPAQSKTR
jgi:hypothetical protein